jgi:hypothetical protein
VKRYIIHLLPEPERRARHDDLRQQVAERIGWNRALDYPTTHVTLVYDVQDDDDGDPIDASLLAGSLDGLAGSGAIRLEPRAPEIHGQHLLLPITDSTQLAIVRRAAFEAARRIAALPNDQHAQRAERVKEQDWPHLTMAQEVDVNRARAGQAFLAERGQWASQPLLATEIALIGRDLSRDEPYQIVHRVSLEARSS